MTRVALLAAMSLGLWACQSSDGDPPGESEPNALGGGATSTLQSLLDPESPEKIVVDPPATCGSTFSTPIEISGAAINWVDRYQETTDGTSSTGTIWVQDYGATGPWAGISFFSPSFIPSNLSVMAGDVIDFRGLYQESVCIGSNVDFQQNGGDAVLPQVSNPTVRMRFDGGEVKPIEIPLSDLKNYETGRKWIGMLVTIRDAVVYDAPSVARSGRISVPLTEDTFNGPGLSNEFRPLNIQDFPLQRGLKSVTGVVTWFFSFKIATRTPEDIVFE